MKEQGEIRTYLERYRNNSKVSSVIIRAGNVLLRYNVNTMREAAELSDEKIARMRNVGVKTKAFIRQVIEDYKREQGGAG